MIHYRSKFGVCKIFFFCKEINTAIKQWCIKLIRNDSKYIYNTITGENQYKNILKWEKVILNCNNI